MYFTVVCRRASSPSSPPEVLRLALSALAGKLLTVYPKDVRPGFADHVLSLLHETNIQPSEVLEAKELQSALGLVAAETGMCIVLSASRQLPQRHCLPPHRRGTGDIPGHPQLPSVG